MPRLTPHMHSLDRRLLMSGDFGWAITHGNSGSDRGNALTVDGGGNVITAGVYNGAVNMGGATLPSLGTNAAFIAKYSSSSSLKWARGIGGSGEQNIQAVAVDSSGNVYAAGYFSGSIDMNPGSGVNTLTSKGQHDEFLLKLDPNGNYLWSRQFGGSGDEGATGLAVDSGGHPFVLGMFSSSGDYNPGPAAATLTTHGGFDVSITKLDANGNFLFAKSVGGSNDDYANGIAIQTNGDPVFVGTFKGTIDLDPSAGTSSHASRGGKDIFLDKLNGSTGSFSYGETFGGISDDNAGDVNVDRSANIFIAGDFSGSADFDPSSKTVSLSSAGSSDAFVSKLSSAGSLLWAKRVGGSQADRGVELTSDSAGNVVVTGQFAGTADFDPGSGVASRSASGGNSLFALKLSAVGAYVWSRTPQGGNGVDVGEGVGLDTAGNVYVTGTFGGTLDFDPAAATASHTASGTSDFFLWKLINA